MKPEITQIIKTKSDLLDKIGWLILLSCCLFTTIYSIIKIFLAFCAK